MKKFKLLTIFTMSFLYVSVGVSHFTNPDFFKIIMPKYIPYHNFFIFSSGFFEILFGLMMLHKKTRRKGALGLIFLLMLVFPANIYLNNSYEAQELIGISSQGAFIRLFFQIPLIVLAYWHSQNKTSKIFDALCSIIFFPTIIYFLTL